MKKWEVVQRYLARQKPGHQFRATDLAASLHITVQQATQLIQAHLAAQRSPRSMTQFVLSREGRTRSAVWHAGQRTADAYGLSLQTADDFGQRVLAALKPDLERMGGLNPRAVPVVNALVQAFVASVNLLVTSSAP